MKNYVIEDLMERLDDYEGVKVDICDLNYYLYENENIDGVLFYNNYKAYQFIIEHFSEIGEVINGDYNEMIRANPFLEPDKFLVQVILEYSSYIIYKSEFVNNNQSKRMILDKETIEIIKKELEEQKGIEMY